MTPVEQRATPVAVPHVALRLLGLVAVDVADDPPHVVDIVPRVVGLVLPEDLDNLSARLVALGFAPAVALTDRVQLVSLEPVLQLLSGHVDRLVELLNHLLVALCHLPSLRLAAYANAISIFGSSTRVAEKRSLHECSCI